MELIENLKIVFIVGCQRTGTTLVGNILGAHPQAFLIDEPNGLYPWINAVFTHQDNSRINALFRQCCQNARANYQDPDARCNQSGELSSEVTHLILKAPNLTYSADQIIEFFPAQFCVFTYRDIRDVVVSMSKLDWIPMVKNQLGYIQSNSSLVTRFSADVSALKSSMLPAHQARAYIGKIKTSLRDTFKRPRINKLDVCYEDLVSQPGAWRSKLLQHIQLPEWPQGLNHAQVMVGWGPGLTYRQGKINTFSVGQWKSYLTAEQENQIWAIAGTVMQELQYSREPVKVLSGKMWEGISYEGKHQPIIATGRGGSGTRLLSKLMQNMDIFIGLKHQTTEDSLEWVNLLYKIAIEHNRSIQPNRSKDRWCEALQETAGDMLVSGRWDGKQLWGWKLPETMMCLPEVFNAFGRGKLIHLLRHPVDISLRRTHMTSRYNNELGKSVLEAAYESLSWNQSNIKSDPAYLHNAASWYYQVSNVTRFGREELNPHCYLEIRYEDICENPRVTLERLADFLGTPVPPLTTYIEIDPCRRRAWSSPDPRADEVWEICGDLAIQLGYHKHK